jgi:hypothetical protein
VVATKSYSFRENTLNMVLIENGISNIIFFQGGPIEPLFVVETTSVILVHAGFLSTLN